MSELLTMAVETDPTTDDMAACFQSAVEGRRYIEFRYVPQKTYRDTPSRQAAQADTVFRAPLDEVKGYLADGAVFWAKTTQHWCIRVYSMNRLVKGDAGYYSARHNRATGSDFRKREFLPRTYRLCGVRLRTVVVGAGRRGKVRLFPELQGDVPGMADARQMLGFRFGVL